MAAALLKGTAFLTGAGSGIGAATAFALAKHGIKALTITDINKNNLLATANALSKLYPGVEIETLELNVQDEEAVESSVAAAVKRFGRLDLGVNIAGIGGEGKATHESSSADWNKVLDVNLNGVWRSQRALLRVMVGQEDLGPRCGRGNIINVSSMYGICAPPPGITSTPYTAAKHGVVGLTKADAVQYAASGIRINAICPGYVVTPLLKDAMEAGFMKPEIERTPMRRMATSEEVAESIVYLASPMSSFMTGAELVVDGGYSV